MARDGYTWSMHHGRELILLKLTIFGLVTTLGLAWSAGLGAAPHPPAGCAGVGCGKARAVAAKNAAGFRCIRIWTGEDGQSHFEKGWLDLDRQEHGDWKSAKFPATRTSFQTTAAGGSLEWHTAPIRQLVITLSGKLDFKTRSDQHFTLEPGVILLAEDTTGGGHTWRIIGSQPWRRVYVVLEPGVAVPFQPDGKAGA